jgi:hypothetical protein
MVRIPFFHQPSFARIATSEDRHLAQSMIVVPLDAPLARVHPIFKDHGSDMGSLRLKLTTVCTASGSAPCVPYGFAVPVAEMT